MSLQRLSGCQITAERWKVEMWRCCNAGGYLDSLHVCVCVRVLKEYGHDVIARFRPSPLNFCTLSLYPSDWLHNRLDCRQLWGDGNISRAWFSAAWRARLRLDTGCLKWNAVRCWYVQEREKKAWRVKSIHPSTFYTRLICRSGRGGAGAYPSGHRARGGVHPGQVTSPSQGHTETNNHARSHSHVTFLETPINLTCMFVDGGRKPEYSDPNLLIHGENMQTPHWKAPGGDRTWNPLAVRRRCEVQPQEWNHRW